MPSTCRGPQAGRGSGSIIAPKLRDSDPAATRGPAFSHPRSWLRDRPVAFHAPATCSRTLVCRGGHGARSQDGWRHGSGSHLPDTNGGPCSSNESGTRPTAPQFRLLYGHCRAWPSRPGVPPPSASNPGRLGPRRFFHTKQGPRWSNRRVDAEAPKTDLKLINLPRIPSPPIRRCGDGGSVSRSSRGDRSETSIH